MVLPMKIRSMPERQTHGGVIRRLLAEGMNKELIDFSASMNPFPPRIQWNPEECDLSAYPDDTYHDLKEAIGRVFSRDISEITVGNGSVELIRIYAQVMVPYGFQAFIERSTFGEYRQSVLLSGGSVTHNPTEKVDVRYVCNPNNPTGKLLKRGDLLDILNTCTEEGSSLFLDEAFIDLSDPDQSLANHHSSDLFVLRSLTKAFSVPGIRFGFGFGDPELIDEIEMTRPPWSVNRYAEVYTMEAIRHLPDLFESRRLIAIERDFLMDCIRSLGYTPLPSSTNYILVMTGGDAADLSSRLLRKGVLVRDCTSFGLPDSIRIAVRTREENRVLIEALSACVS